MATISNISVVFSANTAAFTSGLQSMKVQATAVTTGIATEFVKAQLAIEALKMAADGIKQIFTFAADGIAASVKEISALVDAANKIGISSSQLQAFSEAAKDLGISVESVQGMFGAMARSIEAGADGTAKQVETFNRLGLSVKELQNMAPDKQFEAIKSAINGLSTEAERNSAGMDIFGKKWMEIGPIVRQSTDEFNASVEAAAKTGQMLSESDNAAVKEMGNNWRWLGELVEGSFNQIAAAFAPIFNDLVNGFKAWITEGTNFSDTLMLIVNIIQAGILVVGQITDYFNAFIKLGSAGMLVLATGVLQFGETAIEVFKMVAQFFIDQTINPIIKAWNELPFVSKIAEVKFTALDGTIDTIRGLKEASAEASIDFYEQSKNALTNGVAEGMMAGFDKFNSALTSVGRRAGEQASKDIASSNNARPNGTHFGVDNTTDRQHQANVDKMRDMWASVGGDAERNQAAYEASIQKINVQIRELAKDGRIATGELMNLEAALKGTAKAKYDDAMLEPTRALVDGSQRYINIDPLEKLRSQLDTIEAMKKAQLDWADAGRQSTNQALVNNAALSRSQIELEQRYIETYTTLGRLSADFADNFSDGLANVLTSSGNVFKNIGQMFAGVIRQMIQEWLAFQLKVAIKQGTEALWGLARSIFSLGSGVAVDQGAGGFMDNGSGFASAAGIGYAAEGGDISGPTIVGELGPELFIPRNAGTVIPNDALKNGLTSQAPSISYNIYAYDTTSVESTIERMRPLLQQDALRAYSNARIRRQ